MQVKVLDKRYNSFFYVDAVHFLRLTKAFPENFEAADDLGKKLLKEVPTEDIDIGTTKEDEENFQKKLKEASETERVKRLEKLVSEKIAIITSKSFKNEPPAEKKQAEPTLENDDDKVIDVPDIPFSKKDLDQMDMNQLIAIHQEMFPNKKLPKTKKELIAGILK